MSGLRSESRYTKQNFGIEELADIGSWDQSAYKLGRGGFTHNSDLARTPKKEAEDLKTEMLRKDGCLSDPACILW